MAKTNKLYQTNKSIMNSINKAVSHGDYDVLDYHEFTKLKLSRCLTLTSVDYPNFTNQRVTQALSTLANVMIFPIMLLPPLLKFYDIRMLSRFIFQRKCKKHGSRSG